MRSPVASEYLPIGQSLTNMRPLQSTGVSLNPGREVKEPAAVEDRDGARPAPRISQLLFRLIDAAKLNVIHRATTSPHLAIEAGARKLTLAEHGGRKILVSDRLVAVNTYDHDFVDRFNEMREAVESGADWPGGNCRPQAFLCGIALAATFNAKQKRYDLKVPGTAQPRFTDEKPFIFAQDGTSEARSPYIYLLSRARPSPDAGRAIGMRCYMHPVFDEDIWFPVDSDAERWTLQTKIEWRQQLPPDVKVAIGKPVFDVTHQGIRARADFRSSVADATKSWWRSSRLATMSFGSSRQS